MKKIYDKVFQIKNYSTFDDGKLQYNYTLSKLKQYDFNTLIDIGSGRGHFIKFIRNDFKDVKITTVDLNNYHKLPYVKYIQLDLCENINDLVGSYDVVTCLDCLEHLQFEKIESIIKKLSEICKKHAVFSIANHSDMTGGVELHLIQKNETFWEPLISKYFVIKSFEVAARGILLLFELEIKR